MSKQIAGIILVFISTCLAWQVLGVTINLRTMSQDGLLKGQVGQLWGTPQRQRAPVVHYEQAKKPPVAASKPTTGGVAPATAVVVTAPPDIIEVPVPLEASAVDVDLALEHRRKGLLWYATYRVGFEGEYRIANNTEEKHDFVVGFTFPNEGAVYDDFAFEVGGRQLGDLEMSSSTITRRISLAPGQVETVRIAYNSHGLDEWWYDFGKDVSQVKNFSLAMHTNFDEIDFPQQAISPTTKTQRAGGWDLEWHYTNLLSGVQIGMEVPQKLNPGPWASKISFFAPVSLFFFFFLLFLFSTMQRVDIHPVNYFFIGAGFFSFHLLLAYLVDHISIHAAFAICSAVSLFLVISYMRLVVGGRFAILQVGVAQFVYLVLFSYTFFFEKYTGLAVTVLSISTLFVVMQMTGRTKWSELGSARPELIHTPDPSPVSSVP